MHTAIRAMELLLWAPLQPWHSIVLVREGSMVFVMQPGFKASCDAARV